MRKILTTMFPLLLTLLLAVSVGAAIPKEFADQGFTEQTLDSSNGLDLYLDDTVFKHYYTAGEGYAAVVYDGQKVSVTLHNAEIEGVDSVLYIQDYTPLDNSTVEITLEGKNVVYTNGLDAVYANIPLTMKGSGSLELLGAYGYTFGAPEIVIESGSYTGFSEYDFFYTDKLDIRGGSFTTDGMIDFGDRFESYEDLADVVSLSGDGVAAVKNAVYTMDGILQPHMFYDLSLEYTKSSSGKYYSWNALTKTLTLKDGLLVYDEILFVDDVAELYGEDITVVFDGKVFIGDDLELNGFDKIIIDVDDYVYIDDDINSDDCTEMTIRGRGILEVDGDIEVFGGSESPSILTVAEGIWLMTDNDLEADKLVINGMLYVEEEWYDMYDDPSVGIYHSLEIGEKGGLRVVDDSSEDAGICIAFYNEWELDESELAKDPDAALAEDMNWEDLEVYDEDTEEWVYIECMCIIDDAYEYNYTDPGELPDIETEISKVIDRNPDRFEAAEQFEKGAAVVRNNMMRKHAVVLPVSKGGTITGKTTVNHGRSAEYTITPDEGYVLAALYVNGEEVEAVETLVLNDVTKAYTIKAVFEPVK